MVKKRTSKKSYKVPAEELSEDIVTQQAMMNPPVANARRSNKFYFGVLAVLAIAALLLANKSWVVAGVVNGKPIWRWDLNKAMMQSVGKQMFEQMVSEEIIKEEAQKQHVEVTAAEVEAKQNEVLKSLGANVKLDDFLKYQGMSRADFEKQLKFRLTIEKLLGKDIQITDVDIDKFINTNKTSLTASDTAKMREEARTALLESKISEKLQPWFADLKQKAKVLRFLN